MEISNNLPEEPLPIWASHRSNGNYLEIGSQLLTRDGRVIGNAKVIGFDLTSERPDLVEICTDVGNKTVLSEAELESLFYPPTLVLKPKARLLISGPGSGRTTRMLLEAIRLAKQGKHVFIYIEDISVEDCVGRIEALGQGEVWDFKGNITTRRAHHLDEVNVEKLTHNSNPDIIVLIDHQILEEELQYNLCYRMIQKWNGLSEEL